MTTNPFRLENTGTVAVITVAPDVEKMPEHLLMSHGEQVLAAFRGKPPHGVVVDLGKVPMFGSSFISVLLKFHKATKLNNGELVLACLSDRVRELLYLTALNSVWRIFVTKPEALTALGGTTRN